MTHWRHHKTGSMTAILLSSALVVESSYTPAKIIKCTELLNYSVASDSVWNYLSVVVQKKKNDSRLDLLAQTCQASLLSHDNVRVKLTSTAFTIAHFLITARAAHFCDRQATKEQRVQVTHIIIRPPRGWARGYFRLRLREISLVSVVMNKNIIRVVLLQQQIRENEHNLHLAREEKLAVAALCPRKNQPYPSMRVRRKKQKRKHVNILLRFIISSGWVASNSNNSARA